MIEATIVGGTAAPDTGDIAVHDGRIVAVGECAGLARRTIDRGRIEAA